MASTAGVGLSDTQFNKAREFEAEYWLYIVERPEFDTFRIVRIQDPARRVGYFFYDEGWRDLGETDVQVPL